MGVPFQFRVVATFLTLAGLGCGRSRLVDDDLFTPVDSVDGGTDVLVPDAGADVAEPELMPPGCPMNVRLEGRDASVPVDVIWIVRGDANLLEAFREATTGYWTAIQTGDVDTMNILIVEHEDAIPGPPGGFAGRVRYITDASGDPGFGLLESHEDYSTVLRADSKRHVVVVSSGTTRFTPADLHRSLQEQLGEDYTMHAIVSEQLEPTAENPLGVCSNSMGSAGRGDVVFTAIARRTFGTVSSICAEDWDALITRLSERVAVRVPIPCAFTLPIIRPPGIREYSERGVRLSATVGEESELLRNVEDETQCFAGDWWLYPGSDRVHLCPEACQQIELTRAVLDVELDCGL